MNNKILKFTHKPEIFDPSTSKFWDDEHISKGMLEAHLNPDCDAATRNYNFVCKSVKWISSIASPIEYPNLLDLGCGPGIYAERFQQLGYHVTGVDFSKRSIEYAQSSSDRSELPIVYVNKNYLDISYAEEFDVITMIYCDFGVLSDSNRKTVLNNVYRALKPYGKFIFDVFTPKQYENKQEFTNWVNCDGGFWNKDPHVCLNSFYRYDENNTFLNQTIVISDCAVECYNIWEHTFTAADLEKELNEAGFKNINLYSNIAGADYRDDSNIICAAAKK